MLSEQKFWIAYTVFAASVIGVGVYGVVYSTDPNLQVQKEIRNELQTLNTTLSENFHCVEKVADGSADFEVGKPKK